jgi:phosphate transport system permease protein
MTTPAGVGTSLTRPPRRRERVVEAGLFLAATVGVLTTVGIVIVLAFEALEFFRLVNPVAFFTGTVWSASIEPFQWGVILAVGTLMVALIGLVVAVPLGLLAAVYLAEYASLRTRNLVKPILETIAGIPTIVLGFFALNFVTPVLLKPLFGSGLGTFNALAGGLVVGLLVTPLIASLSEDAASRPARAPRGASRWARRGGGGPKVVRRPRRRGHGPIIPASRAIETMASSWPSARTPN